MEIYSPTPEGSNSPKNGETKGGGNEEQKKIPDILTPGQQVEKLNDTDFAQFLDKAKENSPTVNKILTDPNFLLNKRSWEKLHDSESKTTDPAFWNIKELEFMMDCKNLYDILSVGQNWVKLGKYLGESQKNTALSKIKQQLDDFCKQITEKISVNSKDKCYLHIDTKGDLWVCKNPKAVVKQGDNIQYIIKKAEFHQIGANSPDIVTADGKLITNDGNEIKSYPLIYVENLNDSEEIIVDNNIIKNDFGTILKKTTTDVTSVIGSMANIFMGMSRLPGAIVSAYRSFDINNKHLLNLKKQEEELNEQIESLEKQKQELVETILTPLSDSDREKLNNQIKTIENTINDLKTQLLSVKHHISILSGNSQPGTGSGFPGGSGDFGGGIGSSGGILGGG